MKKLIILILFTIISVSNSQNSEPSPYSFVWSTDSISKPLEVDSFNIDGFKLGFQWSGSSQMSNALYHNIIHGKSFAPHNYDSNFTEDMHVIGQPGVEIKNMASIQYEPTLLTSDYKNFATRPNDPTNAVFGFNNIQGTVYDSTFSGDINYNRMMLFQDSMGNYPADGIVLSDITPKDQFFTDKWPDESQLEDYDGENWNISINLRRFDLDDVEESDDVVLVIKLPYIAKDTAGNYTGISPKRYISFDSIPTNSTSSKFIELRWDGYLENRGYVLKKRIL